MIHFAANLSLLYPDLPFAGRFRAASDDGFRGVEFLFPYEFPAEDLLQLITRNQLEVVLFNLPPGDLTKNEWGRLSNPGQVSEFRRDFQMALEYARVLNCHLLNMMFGQLITDLTFAEQMACARENLCWAAPLAEEFAVTLLLEPLNPIDFPRYGLNETNQAIQLLREVDSEQVKLQFDLYHCVMSGEDPYQVIRDHLSMIKHIQFADVPGRHQPGTGQFNFREFFRTLETKSYPGACSLEYIPEGDMQASLAWMKEYEWR